MGKVNNGEWITTEKKQNPYSLKKNKKHKPSNASKTDSRSQIERLSFPSPREKAGLKQTQLKEFFRKNTQNDTENIENTIRASCSNVKGSAKTQQDTEDRAAILPTEGKKNKAVNEKLDDIENQCCTMAERKFERLVGNETTHACFDKNPAAVIGSSSVFDRAFMHKEDNSFISFGQRSKDVNCVKTALANKFDRNMHNGACMTDRCLIKAELGNPKHIKETKVYEQSDLIPSTNEYNNQKYHPMDTNSLTTEDTVVSQTSSQDTYTELDMCRTDSRTVFFHECIAKSDDRNMKQAFTVAEGLQMPENISNVETGNSNLSLRNTKTCSSISHLHPLSDTESELSPNIDEMVSGIHKKSTHIVNLCSCPSVQTLVNTDSPGVLDPKCTCTNKKDSEDLPGPNFLDEASVTEIQSQKHGKETRLVSDSILLSCSLHSDCEEDTLSMLTFPSPVKIKSYK